MDNQNPLSDLLARFRQGALSRPELESAIFVHVRENAHRFKLKSMPRDDLEDFIGSAFPRISRAVDSYRETGASFDAYVASILRWKSVAFRAAAADRAVLERACWRDRAMEASEAAQEYDATGGPDPLRIAARPRHVMILALKSCLYVSDDFARRIERELGLDAEGLRDRLRELRRAMADQERRLAGLRERASVLYYRRVSLRARAEAAPEGSTRKSELEAQAASAEARLASIRRKLAAASKTASNRLVARSLGIPKGTVDSCLHAIKKRASEAGFDA